MCRQNLGTTASIGSELKGFLLYEGWPGGGGRTGSGRSGGENECAVYVWEGGQCVVCELCVHGWVCVRGWVGSEDEKPAKVWKSIW